jgi:CRP-like cAMP-binding protein
VSALNEPDLQCFLDRLTRRSILAHAEQQAILNLPGRPESLKASSDFVHSKERVWHASLVLSGIVARFDQTPEGDRQITALYVPGDMPDLHSLVQQEPTSALHTLSPASLLKVPHDALWAIAAQYPAVAEAFWRDCAADASIFAQWVVNVGHRRAIPRLAHLLCEVATRLCPRPLSGEVSFPFDVRQTHLAEATGLSCVHVSRSLSALRRDGLVDLSKRSVRIRDWSALADVAEFDPGYLQMNLTQ